MELLGNILAAVVGVGAILSWLYVFVHWLKALGHRRPDISISSMLVNGMKAFDGNNFTEAGQAHVRAMTRGFIAFFLCLFLGIAVAALKISQQG
jgi:hypothetical protein